MAAKDALIRASDLSGSPKDIMGKRKTRNVTNGSDFSPHKSPTNDKAGVTEAKEPGHRGHRADRVFDSVNSGSNPVGCDKRAFSKSVTDVGNEGVPPLAGRGSAGWRRFQPGFSHTLSEEGRTMFARPTKDFPADSGSHRVESAEA